MKANAHFALGCAVFWLFAVGDNSLASANPITAQVAATAAAISQVPGSDDRDASDVAKRNRSKELLDAARQAMARGDLQRADQLIRQAESLNVRYDRLYEPLMDTPAKARQALNAMRNSVPGAAGLPSQRFSPFDTRQTAAPADSYDASAGTADISPNARLEMLTNDSRSKAQAYLQKGRLALQQGDTTMAIAWRQKAIATGARFNPGEYSPETLAVELQRAGVPASRLAVAPPEASPMYATPDDFARLDNETPLLPGRSTQPNQPRNSNFNTGVAQTPYNVNPVATPLDSRPNEMGAAAGNLAGGAYAGSPSNAPRRLPATAAAETPAGAANTRRAEALQLVAMARASLDAGQALRAKRLVDQALALRVPDEAFAPGDPRPELLLLEVNSVLNRQGGMVAPVGYNDSEPAGGLYDNVANAYGGNAAQPRYPVQQGVYDPNRDPTRNVAAQAFAPGSGMSPNVQPPISGTPLPQNPNTAPQGEPLPNPAANVSPGYQLYQQGVAALAQQNREQAMQLFEEAWKHQEQMDPVTRQQLRDKLTLLRVATPRTVNGESAGPLEEVVSQQELLRQKLAREVSREQTAAEKMRNSDPRGSLERLKRLRERIEQEQLDPPNRKYLLTMVDRSIRAAEQHIELNLADIELDERNAAVMESIEQRQMVKLDKQNKLAQLVEEFNDLINEQRYAEAEVKARMARELEPDSEVVRSMFLTSKLGRRVNEQNMIKEMKEEGFYSAMTAVDRSSVAYNDDIPMTFVDVKKWNELSRTRADWLHQQQSRLNPAELEIQRSLETKVEVRFENRPISEVLDALGRMAGVNVYLDPQGLHAEGVTTDEPISINLTQPISLRSALNLILQPLRLSYVIQNEVLRITSEQTRDSDTYPRVYNVADLVIPIPNFIPSYNIGLPGAIRAAHEAVGYGRSFNPSQSTPFTLAAADANPGDANASVLAQMSGSGMLPGMAPRTNQTNGYSPSGMGGASMADFDTLIDLITSTIAPQTWDAVGGPGSIEGFPTNLSLVVSQTQEVHEQIADLLDQLRRLQDLQVTIEVRFITLNDRFFERIGVDFNFEVDDNSNQIAGQNPVLPDDTGPSIAFGLDPTGQPTIDFDYAFNQGSFGSATPQFGGFDASTAANFGFAILSDIEVFFLLEAAHGDNRTNVLQAPKVTLFNGQTGFVSDTSQRPFVTSVIPVVGDFAAAHQPVIVVLSEGTSLSVQAVVSPDRRFVRLTLVPFFSSIGEVSTFTFNGRMSSDSGTTVADPANEGEAVRNNQQNFTEGTTVQLPTFNFTTVSTTVSVPDGGTVLLGGIKRLSEGRNERGVPLMSKIPYINRLFKNVGIGRDTQSLMMMVTPRIIIQEEEEFLQTGYDSSAE